MVTKFAPLKMTVDTSDTSSTCVSGGEQQLRHRQQQHSASTSPPSIREEHHFEYGVEGESSPGHPCKPQSLAETIRCEVRELKVRKMVC